jgi:hypothetical protein
LNLAFPARDGFQRIIRPAIIPPRMSHISRPLRELMHEIVPSNIKELI